ncbi:MAG TPA: glycosyltransferase [Puia sp.]|nr:glycosyltransferase [Puia sp.]
MHYGLIAIGSRGDVQPFVALALGLLDRGHEVTILAHENFNTFVGDYGIRFHPLPGNVEAMLYTPRGLSTLKKGNMLAFMRFVAKVVARNQKGINKQLHFGTQKADVLVTSLVGMIWVHAIAAKTGKPWATIQLSFPSTPTREFPFALLSFLDFPAYNKLTYKIFDYLYCKDYTKQLNEFRASLGLEPVKGSILKKIAAENTPNLYALSPNLLPRPADWDARSQITGFLHLPPERRGQDPQDGIPSDLASTGHIPSESIPSDLTRWLETGEAPIYIGFGSIPVPDPVKFVRILRQLLAETPYRFIFCQGWSHLDDLPQHQRLYVVETANHDALFPHCRAAVIHGGIGTIATALRARLPLVIASIFADQPWWGKIIARRGLGAHLPFARWSAPRLRAAIRTTETPEVRQRVADLGEKMRREDGLTATIEALETYFAQTPTGPTPSAPPTPTGPTPVHRTTS